ncbi:MmyB family transcriptional regulator [Streptomyces sp. NPDC001100]
MNISVIASYSRPFAGCPSDGVRPAARWGTPGRPSHTVRPHLKLLLESLRPNPAYVISRSLDLLAWNPGGLALYAGLDDWPVKQRNLARYFFLHPAARELFHDWEWQITNCVARLRAIAGTAPDAPDLTNLVGELLLKSPDFAGLWERYEVTGRKPAQKTFHHPQVGTLTLTSQSLHIEGTPGQRIGVHTAEPGSPDHDAMLLLDMGGAGGTGGMTAPSSVTAGRHVTRTGTSTNPPPSA